MSGYRKGGSLLWRLQRLLPDSRIVRKTLPRALFHPVALLVFVLTLATGTFVSHRWVRSGEQFAEHSFDRVAINLGEEIEQRYQTSEKLLNAISHQRTETIFSTQDWIQFASLLQELEDEHVISQAWLVHTEPPRVLDTDSSQSSANIDSSVNTPLYRSGPQKQDTVAQAKNYPAIEGFWGVVQGTHGPVELVSSQPGYVVESSLLAARSGEKVSFREKSANTSIVMAVPISCSPDTGSLFRCSAAIVATFSAQRAIDSIRHTEMLPPNVSVGITWKNEQSLIAAHPATMSVLSNPEKAGIFQTKLSIPVATEDAIDVILSRNSRYVGTLDRAQYLDVLYLGSAIAAFFAYLLSVVIVYTLIGLRTSNRSLSHLLEGKERQLATMSDSSPFGIMITGARGECVYANPVAEELFEAQYSELYGQGWKDSLCLIDSEDFFLSMKNEAQLDRKQKISKDVQLGTSEKVKDVRVTMLPIYDREHIVGTTLFFHDNDSEEELKAQMQIFESAYDLLHARYDEVREHASTLEQEVVATREELERIATKLGEEREKNSHNPRVKSGFLNTLRSELRMPLSSILTSIVTLYRMAHDEGNQKLEEIANEVCWKTEDALGVIDDLLDFSRIDIRKVELEQIACSPLHLLNDIEKIAAAHAEAAGVSYGRFVVGDIPHTIVTDRFRLRRALQQLISSAISTTEIGGVKVCIRYDATKDHIEYEVIDTGEGFSERDLEIICTGTDSIDTVPAHLQGFIHARTMLQEIGGALIVSSRVGSGTVAKVLIPAHPVRVDSEPVVQSHSDALFEKETKIVELSDEHIITLSESQIIDPEKTEAQAHASTEEDSQSDLPASTEN